jgi:hypothetical protein
MISATLLMNIWLEVPPVMVLLGTSFIVALIHTNRPELSRQSNSRRKATGGKY